MGGLRIVGGELGGRRIAAPPGRDTRPTADRVREAVFSILGDVRDAEALDLFAGSGALAFEALSRGAASATLVERDPRALAAIRRNAADLGVTDRVRVVAADWRRALSRDAAAGRAYGLCLIDPPYSLLARIKDDLGALLAPVLAPGARVVVEHAARTPPLELPELPIAARTDRSYGDTAVSILRLEGR
ncbi:MAG: 16S rRNA (guanine(966)-N(2))-methyltransferase RsmD [Actinomycetota bacterium]